VLRISTSAGDSEVDAGDNNLRVSGRRAYGAITEGARPLLSALYMYGKGLLPRVR
jgi:hypothetical protein